MLIGREKELQYLNNLYAKAGSQMVVLYGQKHIGKTALIRQFAGGRRFFYYAARQASYKEQCYRMTEEFADLGIRADVEDYGTIMEAVALSGNEKQILIIDEFQYMVKGSDEFMKALIALIKQEYSRADVFVILASSSVGWVENDMVSRIGSAAYEIKGFLKLKEIPFEEVKAYFPNYSIRQCFYVYSILGAVPGLLRFFDDSLSVQENICRNILRPDAYLQLEGKRYVAEELREPSVYHAILSGLSRGKTKLNELYCYTGFSRAKISVYLNNLIELEIVEKVFSVDTEGRENTRKGIYAIRSHFVNFWFQFLFPHLSKLAFLSEELFYDCYVADDLENFCSGYFGDICREYMMTISKRGELSGEIRQMGVWYGKAGSLDIVAKTGDGRTILGICSFTKEMDETDFEKLCYLMGQAKLSGDAYYLFSGKGFGDALRKKAAKNANIKLIELNSMV